jgi:23S rRNA (guanosine2251-2'-O)-methyltransferase
MDQVIYGINPVIEALRAPETRIREIIVSQGRHRNMEHILELAAQKKIHVRYRDRHEVKALSRGRSDQGVVAVVEGYEYATCQDIVEAWKKSGSRALILILDSIQDPQNLGALIRTAHVSGAHGIVIPKNRAAGVTPTAVKTSAGATAFTPVARVTNIAATIEHMKQEGIWIVGTATEARVSLFQHDFTEDTAVVVGSEGRGIRRRVLNACDQTVSIPMRGHISSLNASVAAGVVLYEAVRQRLMQNTSHEEPRGIRKA